VRSDWAGYRSVIGTLWPITSLAGQRAIEPLPASTSQHRQPA
jgi:hypothetical protein